MLDLKALLAKILGRLLSIDACLIKSQYASVPVGTTDAIWNPNYSYILGGGTFSAGSSNRIVVKEACRCLVFTSAVFSAISNTSSIKVVSLGRNSSNSELSMAATGYPSTWESISALDIVTFNAGDALHFTGRCNAGTNTLRQANIAIIRIA